MWSRSCPLVARRIACEQCGYPFSEALYESVAQYADELGVRPYRLLHLHHISPDNDAEQDQQ